ncbi:hypothetical protein [Filimonas effusa]|uniref:hypothetical protein n=1 Tax=Filimonas effusa TaxID=2508721 RepID=UPI0015F2BBDC|nr:hypothetical protein [Filimonas effusa]
MNHPKAIVSYILIFSFFLFFSCSKREYLIKPNPTKSELISQFLNVPVESPEILHRIGKRIASDEDSYHFLQGIAEREGLPFWNYSDFYYQSQNSQTARSEGGNNVDTIVTIPLVINNEKIVSSILLCKVNGDSMRFTLVRGKAYAKFGFGKPNHFNGSFLAATLMAYSNKIFGDSLFLVKDGRLFNNSDSAITKPRLMRFRAKANSTNSAARMVMLPITQCYTVEHNPDQGELTGLAPDDPRNWPYYEEICITDIVWISIGGGGGGGASTGGSSGGNNNGGYYPGVGGGSGGSSNPPGTPWHYPPGEGPDPNPYDPGDPPIFIDPGADVYSVQNIEDINTALSVEQFFLLPIDTSKRKYLDDVNGYGAPWRALAQWIVPQPIKNRVDSLQNAMQFQFFNSFEIQELDNAAGPVVNCDFFPVRIKRLPTGFSAKTLTEHFRTHINDFIDPDLNISFTPYSHGTFSDAALFNSPYEASNGALIHINMPNNGTVIQTFYSNNSTPGNESHRFRFNTMQSPLDDNHPVSGTREFGVYSSKDQAGEFVFFTRGVDRTSDWMFALSNQYDMVFDGADDLWENMQKNMIKFINDNGGDASYYSPSQVTVRPKWEDVKDYLKGIIDWDTLKTLLGW